MNRSEAGSSGVTNIHQFGRSSRQYVRINLASLSATLSYGACSLTRSLSPFEKSAFHDCRECTGPGINAGIRDPGIHVPGYS